MVSLRLAAIAATVVAASSFSAVDVAAEEPVDLHFGEAVFYAHQGLYFDALNRLDSELAQFHRVDEPVLDSLWGQVDHAEFSVGDEHIATGTMTTVCCRFAKGEPPKSIPIDEPLRDKLSAMLVG